MKKIISVLLITFILLFATGCGLLDSNDKDEDNDNGTGTDKVDVFEDLFDDIEHGARKFIYTFTEDDYNSTVEFLNKMKDLELDNLSELSLSINLINFQKKLFDVVEQSMVVQVYSYIFPTNSEVLAENAKMSELAITCQQAYFDFLIRVSKTEIGKNSFSQEDLDFLVNMEATRDDAYYQLEKDIAVLENQYLELLNTEGTTTFALAEQYVKMVNKNNQIAVKLGYDDYFDYAYAEVYNRNYTYNDLTYVKQGLKENILPNIAEIYVNTMTKVQSLDDAGKLNFQNIVFGEFDLVKSNLDDLATYMGGDYLTHYNYLWEKGEYYIGNQNSNAGAFVASVSDKQIAYFGPGYNNLFTVTHEFGHYAAGREDIKGSDHNFLDLAEFQSQANENLLASFMVQNNEGDASYEAVASYNLLNSLTTVMLSVAVNDFEYEVYNTVNLQASDIEDIMMDVYASYGPNSLDIFEIFYGENASIIWSQTAAPSPCYYITYGMSVIPSIEMFFEATDNLEQAKADYMIIMKAGSDLFETINEIGYTNPLNTNVLEELTRRIREYVA